MLLLSRFIVHGHSMEPTLLHGSEVLVSSLPYFLSGPQVSDIAAFTDKKLKKIFIKRIAKKHGNKYFFSGDNKKDSLDSRKTGWVERKNIVGKVILIRN